MSDDTPDISRPTRGLKNRNPGNIRFVPSVQWRGQTGEDNKGFVVFDSDRNGLRAVVIDLHTHFIRNQAHTIRSLIATYAPPNENDTANYIDFVAKKVGISADDAFTFNELIADAFLAAIVKMEQGAVPYDAYLLTRAVDDAFDHFQGVKA